MQNESPKIVALSEFWTDFHVATCLQMELEPGDEFLVLACDGIW